MEVTVDDEELYDCEIIRFSLQPLVENAIFHGIEPKGTAGRIDIHVYRKDTGDICISVTDDGVGMSEEVLSTLLTDNRTESSQFFKEFGISNVHKRIQYEYGNGYGLSFESEIGKYTKATITLPGKE